MNFKALSILIAVPVVTFIVMIVFNDKNLRTSPYDQENDQNQQLISKENVNPPNIRLDITKGYVALIKTTEGDITIKLNALDTNMTSTNFVYLTKLGFYDDLIFHRVIKDFMIQTGDPRGDGTGGPGYTFENEPFDGNYVRGAVAMANTGEEKSNGSQFFIMHKDRLDMPKNYTIFGRVIQGMEVVDKIAEKPVENNESGEPSKPLDPVKIITVQIIEE